MGEARDRAAEFEARWEKLSATLQGQPKSATITPAAAKPDAPLSRTALGETVALTETNADPKSLPGLSIGSPTDQDLTVGSSSSKSADLQVLRLLGQGGMGQVHLARQTSLDREVAIKSPKAGTPAWASNALVSEARITGGLEHPGIIPVHALGVDEAGQPVLVMKRIEGVEWRALLHEPDHPEWERWEPADGDRLVAHLEILMQVCNAAHFAHDHGVIHRDIKPENVMLGRFGEVYLVDWGIATRLDRQPPDGEGEIVGSPAYMAPEMVCTERVDPQTDVYLLGGSLHEVLTGDMPNPGDTVHEVMLAAVGGAPPELPGVPDELADLCRRALSPARTDRPKSALELRRALGEYLTHRGSIALTDTSEERLSSARESLGAADELPADLAPFQRSVSEARFGFTQALRDWPANDRARKGLDACLRLMIDVELAQENPGNARALLVELSQPDADRERRLGELQQRMDERAERSRTLEAMARGLDERVSARSRAVSALALTVLGIAVTANALYLDSTEERLQPKDTMLFSAALLVAALVAGIVRRKQLLDTTLNRRIYVLLLVGFCSITANRFTGYLYDAPIEQLFTVDAIILTALLAVASVTMVRWLGWLGALYAGAAAAMVLMPEHTPLIFGTSTTVSILIPAWVWWRLGETAPDEKSGPDHPS